jgi:cyclopropane-fatty-acyl-phospholipid synthase
LPLIWEPIAAADGTFELQALRNDSDHYFRTLRIWERNLSACYDEAAALVGEDMVKQFQQYLRASAAGFRLDKTCLLRMSFRKLS